MNEYVIAVTSPEGRTRYIGESTPWVDDIKRAFPFFTERGAQEYIDNANTIVGSRVRAGWVAKIVPVEVATV